ncbi:hypothetical protein QFC20_006066 [Naganishia adeliensis]|uniref:Uncharacterized protein n=1 Tax=Naganishia adeliensis TaxID=92952 RepID=A0ACC2VF53_9TREE|nr:hypothetical protein QFC20_006066 [Naganishia adeliensis]
MGAMLQSSHRFRSLSSYSKRNEPFLSEGVVAPHIEQDVATTFARALQVVWVSCIAQIWAQDNLDIAKARDSYVRAGEWYKQEEANATANQCYQAAAEHSADLGDFGRAIELYEQVGDWSLASPLTKYSVKEYWLRACLCAMAMGDLVTCNRLLTTFAQKDVTFPSTREYKLAAAVMDACEQGDVDAFTQAVYEYDQLTKLDNTKTGILLRIKKGLEMEMDGGLT